MAKKPDIWMPLYIGDYLADTSHLDAERHGCYLLWMMHYWRKGPLLTSIPDLISLGRLRGADAPSIVQALLEEFFSMGTDGRWHQKRQDAEREKWQQKKVAATEKAEKAANARWGDATSNAPSTPPSSAPAMLERCPLPSPLPLPLPKTTTIDANMMARGLCERLNLSRGMGRGTVYDAVYDLALQEEKRGGDLEELCDRMEKAYMALMKAAPTLGHAPWGPAKFFADGHWNHPERWNGKKKSALDGIKFANGGIQ